MELHTISFPDVTPLKFVTAKATYGIGFLTAFVGGFCALFGIPNNMYTEKIKKAEALAMKELETNAKSIGADGVMDVRCQIDGLSFLITGTAYKWSAEERAKREAETKTKHEAKLKTQREVAEKVKHEAEEKAKEQEAEIEQPSGEQCQLCGKYFEHLSYCKIIDDMGTRYRNICDDCIQKHNATKQ